MSKRKFINKNHNIRKLVINLTLLLLIVMGIGYSTLFTQLAITGTMNVNKVEIPAVNLTYDNTNSEVDCDDTQCMIDYINDLLG